jgi:predicted metal-dependent enzyme (double-stranded beta helix superfamily)
MFDLDDFVEQCRSAVGEPNGRAAIKELVATAVTDRTALEALARDEPTFNVAHRSPELTVLHLVMPAGLESSPHDHLMWAVVGIVDGQEDNTFFRSGTPALVPSGGRELRPGETLSMGDDTIHKISNPSDRYLCALHVYGGDLAGAPRHEWDGDGRSPRPYDHDAFVARLRGG